MAHISGGEIIEDDDPCEDCRRVLSAMSRPPDSHAMGSAFEHCRMIACWYELQETRQPMKKLDTDVPF